MDGGFCGLLWAFDGWKRIKSRLRRKKLRIWLGGQHHVWRCWRVGHGCGEAAAEKGCTPAVNALSDSEVRRDYMAEACTYLPYDAVVFLW